MHRRISILHVQKSAHCQRTTWSKCSLHTSASRKRPSRLPATAHAGRGYTVFRHFCRFKNSLNRSGATRNRRIAVDKNVLGDDGFKHYWAARPSGAWLAVAANNLPCDRPVIGIKRLAESNYHDLVFSSLWEGARIEAEPAACRTGSLWGCWRRRRHGTKMAFAELIHGGAWCHYVPCDLKHLELTPGNLCKLLRAISPIYYKHINHPEQVANSGDRPTWGVNV